MTSTQEKIRALQMEVTRFQRRELKREEELQKHKKKANQEVIEKEEQITLLQAELQNTNDKWRKELSLQAKQMEDKEDLMQLYHRKQEEQIRQDRKKKREISELQAQKSNMGKEVDAAKAVNERLRAHLESVEKELAKVKEQVATTAGASRGAGAGKLPITRDNKKSAIAGPGSSLLDDAEVEKELNPLKETKRKLKRRPAKLTEAPTQRRLLQQNSETLQKTRLTHYRRNMGQMCTLPYDAIGPNCYMEILRQVFAEKGVKLEKDLQQKEKESLQFLKLRPENNAKLALLQHCCNSVLLLQQHARRIMPRVVRPRAELRAKAQQHLLPPPRLPLPEGAPRAEPQEAKRPQVTIFNRPLRNRRVLLLAQTESRFRRAALRILASKRTGRSWH
ncbi:unnamed protein product [Amoebophrya sp. A120]|nr:unnamed protein product [Amoebophrya sp. A120]|eukprot:GSA120T00025124001.1